MRHSVKFNSPMFYLKSLHFNATVISRFVYILYLPVNLVLFLYEPFKSNLRPTSKLLNRLSIMTK